MPLLKSLSAWSHHSSLSAVNLGHDVKGRRKRRMVVEKGEGSTSYKASRLSFEQSCLLLLNGDSLLLLDAKRCDEVCRQKSSNGQEPQQAVLKLVRFQQVLDVVKVPGGLRVEYVNDVQDIQLISGAFSCPESDSSSSHSGHELQLGSGTNGSSSSPHHSRTNSNDTAMSSGGMHPSSADFLLRNFPSEEDVAQTASTILFQRAQARACQHWLSKGLPAAFAVQLSHVNAVVTSSRHQAQHDALQRAWQQQQGRQGEQLLPWHGLAPAQLQWGSVVPLPAAWDGIIASLQRSQLQHCSCTPLGCDDMHGALAGVQGPKALEVHFSTPLGMAVARVTLKHVIAALQEAVWGQVLAVPLAAAPDACSGNGSTAAQAGLQRLDTGSFADDSSAGSLSTSSAHHVGSDGVAFTYRYAVPLYFDSNERGSSTGLSDSEQLQHSREVYAVLQIRVNRLPDTQHDASTSTAAANADASHQKRAAALMPADAASALDQQAARPAAVAEAPPAPTQCLGGAALLGGPTVKWAVAGLLASLALAQWSASPVLALLQLLLLVAFVASDMLALQTSQAHAAGDTATGSQQQQTLQSLGQLAMMPLPTQAQKQQQQQEDASLPSRRWGITLVDADLVTSPSAFLQLQIRAARAGTQQATSQSDSSQDSSQHSIQQSSQEQDVQQAGTAEDSVSSLRVCSSPRIDSKLSIAESSSSFRKSLQQGSMAGPRRRGRAAKGGDGGWPELVSTPEPRWLHSDVKQRFINAKSSTAESRKQALMTDEWRRKLDVDHVFDRPAPYYHFVNSHFQAHVLLDQNADGNAVVLMRVGQIKQLCDAIFYPKNGTTHSVDELEYHLAFFNEYLTNVAAPNRIPGGSQVQIYDMKGLRLSHLVSEATALFKVLMAFGFYYPERLAQAIVVNPPSWINIPFKIASPLLDPYTRAKILVLKDKNSVLGHLERAMGAENVPAEFGGPDNTPLDQYPAHARMLKFVERMDAGEKLSGSLVSD